MGKKLILAALVLMFSTACEKKPAATQSTGPVTDLYVASGSVYAGLGVTPSSPAQIIARYDTNGRFVALLRDYTASIGDSPVALVDYDENHILALVENTNSRRIELIAKDGSSYSTFITGSSLNGVLRTMVYDYAGGLLVSKSTAVEKFTLNGNRITRGANSYIQAPAGDCATMTANLNSLAIGPDDQIIMANAFTAASANNRIGMISKAGYGVAGDCLAGLAAPTTNHFPTALLMHSSGLLLVAYANNTGPIHEIYSVPVNATSFGAPTLAFSDISILQGITKIVEMMDGSILVAASHSGFNTIERFRLDSSTGLLTRVPGATFIPASLFTRSVSAILAVDPNQAY